MTSHDWGVEQIKENVMEELMKDPMFQIVYNATLAYCTMMYLFSVGSHKGPNDLYNLYMETKPKIQTMLTPSPSPTLIE